MRPLTFEERQDLVQRAGDTDLVEFVSQVNWLGRKYKKQHRQILAILERCPRPTTLPPEFLLRVRRYLAEQGIERTPEEATVAVERILSKIRGVVLDSGMQVPKDDRELLSLIE